MVLTKEELLSSLRHETCILVHLASKVEPHMLDYRPTPKQRSTLELLRYLAVNGPTYLGLIERDGFNGPAIGAAWTASEQRMAAMSFEEAVETIRAQADEYDRLLAGWSDEFLRSEIEMFGTRFSRGKMLVMLVLNAHAAYRTQLFLYLKSCGREELGTMNLWAGQDPR
jgi:hypothetical protein